MADSVQATGLRKGTTILHEGTPYRVLDFEHRTPGNKRGFVQAKLRNLLDGTQRDFKFSAGDMIERAHIDVREMDFLYSDGEGSHFMDTETYDQHALGSDLLADAMPWLSEGMKLQVELLNGAPIGVQLPKSIEVTVREAEPVVKGQTAAKSNKPAVLENGVSVQVPTFIGAGDRIRVDPTEARYIERAK